MVQPVEIEVSGGKWPVAERWALGVFADAEPDLAALGAAGRSTATALLRRRGFRRRDGQTVETAIADGRRAIAIYGLGPRGEFTSARLRAFVERALEGARAGGVRRLAIGMPEHELCRGESAAARTTRQIALSTYRFERFLPRDESRPRLERVQIVVPARWRRAQAAGNRIGLAVAEGIALARDLGNTPPNVATPDWLARQARSLAGKWRARVQVLGAAELRRRGMGGILAVGGGSRNPPRLVRIELGRGGPTVALVGKGVTFDTGGISIKPAAQMDEMKWDKAGACGVLGVLDALHRLKLPLRVRAYLPLAENMPDGAAYRPGDIVRCSNGKTVEIVNTDAEGRMILADALVWAARERPDSLLEFSTLTGACVVALGPQGGGLFTPSEELSRELLTAAEAADERLWRLPLWPEFLEEMKGAHSDLKNSGGRWGGACTAAAFLSQFVDGVERWAHLDIAGPAYVGGDHRAKRGATGYGVALTVEFLRSLASVRSSRA